MDAEETTTVNLRDVPQGLIRRAKAHAALRGQTLKGFVLEAIRQALEAAVPEAASRGFFVVTQTQARKTPRNISRKRKRPANEDC